MKKRAYNFNPGPAALPLEVLKQAAAEFMDFQQMGMSLMEMSHRSIGGIRASAYNAVPLEACQALADYMIDFQRRNG